MYWSLFMLWPLLKTLFLNSPLFFIHNQQIEDSKKYTLITIDKIHNNIISATHSILSVISMSIYLYSQSINWLYISSVLSFSYFIWDTYYIIIQRSSDNYPYILHHVIALVMIQDQLLNYNRNFIIFLFCIAEFSNFPIYVIYHLKKIGYTHNMVYLQLCQLIWFGFFRIIVFGCYIKDCISLIDNIIKLLSLLFIYILGVYWSVCQSKSLYKQYTESFRITHKTE